MNKKKKLELENLIGSMFDKNIAKDVATSEGVGCDNMTCVIVEFKR